MGMKVYENAINYGTLAAGANAQKFKAIWSGATGGSLTITPLSGGTPVVYAGVPAGTRLEVEGSAINTGALADVVWLAW